jgi:hypothetical protein
MAATTVATPPGTAAVTAAICSQLIGQYTPSPWSVSLICTILHCDTNDVGLDFFGDRIIDEMTVGRFMAVEGRGRRWLIACARSAPWRNVAFALKSGLASPRSSARLGRGRCAFDRSRGESDWNDPMQNSAEPGEAISATLNQ